VDHFTARQSNYLAEGAQSLLSAVDPCEGWTWERVALTGSDFVPKPPRKLKGRPTFDARGNVTWKFAEKSGVEVGTESVRALADGLSLEAPSRELSPDPYNQTLAHAKDKSRRRSLDDMRRLDEVMKREHEELVKGLRTGKNGPQARSAGAIRRVLLRFEGREVLLDQRHPSLSLGRGEDNDVVISGERVSREHARIEYNGSKLVLIDRSVNGTFVQTASGELSRIRRGRTQVAGEGMIGLGRRPKQNSSYTVHFVCEGFEPEEKGAPSPS
jgi:FHA domain-containing protein